MIGGFDTKMIEHELFKVELALPRILEVKSGQTEPIACGTCEYCRVNKKLDGVINFKDLIA